MKKKKIKDFILRRVILVLYYIVVYSWKILSIKLLTYMLDNVSYISLKFYFLRLYRSFWKKKKLITFESFVRLNSPKNEIIAIEWLKRCKPGYSMTLKMECGWSTSVTRHLRIVNTTINTINTNGTTIKYVKIITGFKFPLRIYYYNH